jgi:hypothetical protein
VAKRPREAHLSHPKPPQQSDSQLLHRRTLPLLCRAVGGVVVHWICSALAEFLSAASRRKLDNMRLLPTSSALGSTLKRAMWRVQILTGENWNEVMYDAMRATSPLAATYFLFVLVCGNWVLLNLFLAILLDNFASDKSDDDFAEEEAADSEEEVSA